MELIGSSPVMDAIQKHITLNYVKDLQDECISYMTKEFSYNTYTMFRMMSFIANDCGLEDMGEILDISFDFLKCIKIFLQRHPEFRPVYKLYKEWYENRV